MPFTMMIAAPSSAKFVERFGSRKVVSTGLLILGLGLLLLAQSDVDTPYWHLVVAIVTMAAGMGLSMAPSTTGIMASLPLRKAGVGSAVNDTTRELGGALGVAVLGSLLASRFTAALPASVDAAAGGGPGGRPVIARRRPRRGPARCRPAVGGPLAAAAKGAYVDAMSVSLVAAAFVVVAAAVMVRRFYPDRIVPHERPRVTAPRRRCPARSHRRHEFRGTPGAIAAKGVAARPSRPSSRPPSPCWARSASAGSPSTGSPPGPGSARPRSTGTGRRRPRWRWRPSGPSSRPSTTPTPVRSPTTSAVVRAPDRGRAQQLAAGRHPAVAGGGGRARSRSWSGCSRSSAATRRAVLRGVFTRAAAPGRAARRPRPRRRHRPAGRPDLHPPPRSPGRR